MISSATVVQFSKFSAIGLLNSGIHYGIFYVLFRMAGIHYLAASAIGYSFGVINSFVWNKAWTFRTRGSRKDVEFIRFIIVNIASLLINLGSLDVFVTHLGTPPEPAQVLAIGCSLCANFLGNKYWTFKKLPRLSPETR